MGTPIWNAHHVFSHFFGDRRQTQRMDDNCGWGNRVQTKPWHVCSTTGIARINLHASPAGVDFKMHITFYSILHIFAHLAVMYYYSISDATCKNVIHKMVICTMIAVWMNNPRAINIPTNWDGFLPFFLNPKLENIFSITLAFYGIIERAVIRFSNYILLAH